MSALDEAYNTLHLNRDASACDVKQAYKKLALRHHPGN